LSYARKTQWEKISRRGECGKKGKQK